MKPAIDAAHARQLLRKAMPIVESAAYFDHAAVAPISGPAAEKIRVYASDLAHSGDLVWPDYAAEVERCREAAAQMINGKPSEIAWIANTTQGINFVAEGLDWRAGDNIVTLANEFPSNLYPWLQLKDRGVETRLVEAPMVPPSGTGQWTVEDLLSQCDRRTRLISVSWVGFATGFRGPIEPLVDAAHRQGMLVFLDAIQGLGVFPLDVRKVAVDFFAADGHKWMLGPEGAGIFFATANSLNCLRPMNVGWNSVVGRYDFDRVDLDLRDSTARYEGGTQNVPGVTALGASLELLRDCGLGHQHSMVADAVLENASLLSEQLRSFGAVVPHSPDYWNGSEHASGIVTFDIPGVDLPSVRDHCLKRRVPLSYRGGWLRASPHAYMSESDVAQLLDALRQVPR